MIAVIDLIVIIFLVRRNSNLAIKKGANPLKWKIVAVVTWLAGRAIGFLLGALLFGSSNNVGIYWISLLCAVGGYMIVKAALKKKTDLPNNENSNADDLKPPQNQ
jgi:hypothetical protein